MELGKSESGAKFPNYISHICPKSTNKFRYVIYFMDHISHRKQKIISDNKDVEVNDIAAEGAAP